MIRDELERSTVKGGIVEFHNTVMNTLTYYMMYK